MNDINWEKVETIIDQALDLPAEERKMFVDNQCGENQQLKSEVTLLLESIFDSEGWLEDPQDYKKDFYEEISDDVDLLSTNQPLIGKQVGAYAIREKIGEGGMGTVYRAERSEGEFDHQVAIKIIRRGRSTDENKRRFRREQHILAGFNHPNIARLFDGGITDDGFPYIIMEYVAGTPIDEYCETNNCSINEKVALFKQVLEAIRYAHENLVIHRDLKPGNILVDENGNIKMLDFGISKLLEDDTNTSLTHTGTRLLTPRYAAPEQIRQENTTTASDLYALGIVFYQLLTGGQPFNLEDLSQYEMEQAILKQEAPKPSSKVDDPPVQKKLRGDLDAIALKAIRKESESRYRMANEFLADLQNYQKGLPVSARNDSLQYRTKKYIQRNAQGIIVAATILFLILSFVGFYSWRITQERDQAELEAQKASQISDFLMSLFKANKPNQSKGEVVTAQMLLKEGEKKAESLNEQPNVKARMLSIIGEVQMEYGNYASADSLFHSALKIENTLDEPDHAQRLAIMNNYGNLLERQGKYHSADSVLTKVLDESKLYDMPLQTAITLNDLGNIAQLQSKYTKAESLHTQALHLRTKLYGHKSKSVAASLNNIGWVLHEQGMLKEAEKYYQKSLTLNKGLYGNLHTETTMTMRNLGKLYKDMGQIEHADSFLTETIKLDRKLLSNNHPRLAEDLNELAVLNGLKGNLIAADSLFKETLSIQKTTLPPDHPRIALTLNNLAWVAKETGEIKVAEQHNREALAIARQRFGAEHFNTAMYTHNLANVLLYQNNYGEAEPLYRQAIATLRNILPPDHIRISNPLYDLGRLLRKTNRLEQAEPLLREALTIRIKRFGKNHIQTALTQAALGKCLINTKRYKEAKILLEKSYKTLVNQKSGMSKVIKEILTNLQYLQKKN